MIKDLPNKLQKLRTKYGYSQKQVAEKLRISPSVVSSYETGERTPSTDVLLSLSYLYGCSTDYLLGKQVDKPAKIINVEGLTDKQVQILCSLVDTMKK